MLTESFSKGLRGLSYVFFITSKVPTLAPIDGSTFIFHGVLILRGNQEVFNGAVTLEVGLYAILISHLFDAFACSLDVRYDNVTLEFYFIGGGISTSSALGISLIHPVYGPIGVLAVGECLPEMIHFFLEKLRFIANCFDPVGKYIDYTIFR